MLGHYHIQPGDAVHLIVYLGAGMCHVDSGRQDDQPIGYATMEDGQVYCTGAVTYCQVCVALQCRTNAVVNHHRIDSVSVCNSPA